MDIDKILSPDWKTITIHTTNYYILTTLTNVSAGMVIGDIFFLCYSSQYNYMNMIAKAQTLEEAKSIIIADALSLGFMLPTSNQNLLL